MSCLFQSRKMSGMCFSFGKKYISYICKTVNLTNKVQNSSLVEFSDIPNVSVGENSIVSGLETSESFNLYDDLMIFTVALKGGKFVSCAFTMEDDVKKIQTVVNWMGIDFEEVIRLVW